MKRIAYFIILTLVLVSCGTRKGYFKIEGHLLNLNQGEFYIYSTDGIINGFDTIKIEGGRFTYEIPCKETGTLVIVFPNYSEQPVFTQAGKSVTISGDASHLKEIEIEGTDENKLMNGFRKQIVNVSPPEELSKAEQFIKNNPASIVSVYILKKYFVTNPDADLNKAAQLAEAIHKAQPKNGNIARIVHFINVMKKCTSGSTIPSFTAKDINGNTVSSSNLKGKIAVVCAWATWNSDSRGMINKLNNLNKENKEKLAIIGINLDASKRSCKQSVKNDSTSTIHICDQLMFESPLMEKFALTRVSDNIIFNAQGRVIERGLSSSELEKKLKTLLN
ncbi:MAG: DUF4369 domain-containing protein [Prevotellaceae bacterium]|nr:DUF4369 domain-containing protein [Prevotellaceae bacterium]